MPDIFNLHRKPKNQNLAEDSRTQISNPLETPDNKTLKNTTEQLDTKTISQNSLNIFSTFVNNPSGVSFVQQDPEEKVVLFLRRHFGTNLSWIISTVILLVAPFLIRFIFKATGFSLPFFPSNFIRLFTIFYYFVVAGFAFSNFLTWFFTVGLITDKRAVDLDFVNVSSVNFASADLEDIIDAKYSQNGFSQSFFNYGDIVLAVQTPLEKLVFDKAPKPAEIANIIDDLAGIKHNV